MKKKSRATTPPKQQRTVRQTVTGMARRGAKAFFYFKSAENGTAAFSLSSIGSGSRIVPLSTKVVIGGERGLSRAGGFRTGQLKGKGYFLAYRVGSSRTTYCATSRDLVKWKKTGKLGVDATLAPDYRWKGKFVQFSGEKKIDVSVSGNLKQWRALARGVIAPRKNFFDSQSLTTIGTLVVKQGILLVYGAGRPLVLGAALLDKKNPSEVLWRSDFPLWRAEGDIEPLGLYAIKDTLLFYFASKDGGISEVAFSLARILRTLPKRKGVVVKPLTKLELKKSERNPIIEPIPSHPWESQATFNAAALYEDGKVHILYRAIGDNGLSVLGYASSKDGIHIDERLPEPVFVPQHAFDLPDGARPSFSMQYMSGGGYGGCEDPRLTRIGDRIYMTYVAFDGSGPPRVALTSISVDDFLNKRWNWKQPALISPPGVVDKNAVLFPEQIDGKYIMFHRIFPNILIDFLGSLEFKDGEYLKGQYMIAPRKALWDSRKIGAGAPPLRTKDGWLLIYHAIDDRDSSRYKIGVMLLDPKDPRRVLARSDNPIIEPTEYYENEGHKAGVAYPCGAVIVGNQLFVYYGGADKVLCVATKNLNEFLDDLKLSRSPTLEPVLHTRRVFAYNAP